MKFSVKKINKQYSYMHMFMHSEVYINFYTHMFMHIYAKLCKIMLSYKLFILYNRATNIDITS